MTNTEVVIVGAGPVGISAAAFLDAAGVAVELVDVAAEPSPYSKATTVHPRTLEVLRGVAGSGSGCCPLPRDDRARVGGRRGDAPVVAAAIDAVPADHAGMASGAVNTVRQLGLAVGLVVFGTVFSARITTTLTDAGVRSEVVHAAVGGQAGAVVAAHPELAGLIRTASPTGSTSSSSSPGSPSRRGGSGGRCGVGPDEVDPDRPTSGTVTPREAARQCLGGRALVVSGIDRDA